MYARRSHTHTQQQLHHISKMCFLCFGAAAVAEINKSTSNKKKLRNESFIILCKLSEAFDIVWNGMCVRCDDALRDSLSSRIATSMMRMGVMRSTRRLLSLTCARSDDNNVGERNATVLANERTNTHSDSAVMNNLTPKPQRDLSSTKNVCVCVGGWDRGPLVLSTHDRTMKQFVTLHYIYYTELVANPSSSDLC